MNWSLAGTTFRNTHSYCFLSSRCAFDKGEGNLVFSTVGTHQSLSFLSISRTFPVHFPKIDTSSFLSARVFSRTLGDGSVHSFNHILRSLWAQLSFEGVSSNRRIGHSWYYPK